MKRNIIFFWALGAGGCTTPPPNPSSSQKSSQEEQIIHDPLEEVNRKIFSFNQVVQDLFWTPVINVYQTMLPPFLRKGVYNMISTTNSLSSGITRCLFADFHQGQEHFVRFLLNAFLGVGGWVDVAEEFSLKPQQYDFGKALEEKGGVGPGIFLNIPFLGPTTSRDIVGTLFSGAASFFFPFHWLFYSSFSAMDLFHQQIHYQDALGYLNSNFYDPYRTMRQTYYQLRGDLKKENEDFYQDLEASLSPSEKIEKIHKKK